MSGVNTQEDGGVDGLAAVIIPGLKDSIETSPVTRAPISLFLCGAEQSNLQMQAVTCI